MSIINSAFLRTEGGEGILKFLKFPSNKTLEFVQFARGISNFRGFIHFSNLFKISFFALFLETKIYEQYGPSKVTTIPATGGTPHFQPISHIENFHCDTTNWKHYKIKGGSYKYAIDVKEKLGITLQQHPEMECLIRGQMRIFVTPNLVFVTPQASP